MQTSNDIACDILLDGGYFCDLVFTGLPELPRLGHEIYSRHFNLIPGGAFNSAVALHRLGLRVAWPCAFGSDPFSQYVRENALKEGLDAAFFSQTGQPSLHITVAFSFNEERAFLSYSDPYTDLPLREVLQQLRPPWLYLSHLAFGDAYLELMAEAHRLGSRIYMDCQAHDRRLEDAAIAQALRAVDVFSPNADEARRLTGLQDVEEAARALADYCPLIIIKLGAQGCLCQQGGETLRVPAIQVNVTDTTGAGDNFDSGFLCGQLRGFSLRDSLCIANICGGLSTQGYGGTSSSPTWNQVKRFLE